MYRFIKTAIIIAAIGSGTVFAPLSPVRADSTDKVPSDDEIILGHWTPPDMDAVIAIKECDGVLCADLVAHDYAEQVAKDFQNPDPALRERPLLGVRILDGLRLVKAGKWNMGVLYDPRTGKSYRSAVRMIDRDRVKITGCIGPGLCKGYIWTRVLQSDDHF